MSSGDMQMRARDIGACGLKLDHVQPIGAVARPQVNLVQPNNLYGVG